MKVENIETIKRRFHREWLLIAVNKFDESTTTPISGRLIAHSPHRDEIYRKLLSLRRRHNMLVECSEDRLPKGYAAAYSDSVGYHLSILPRLRLLPVAPSFPLRLRNKYLNQSFG